MYFQLFQEIARVLRNGGRYICFSLLQEHILKELLSYFPNSGFMFRIIRCHEAEAKARIDEGSSIPVFAVVATKFINLQQTVSTISSLIINFAVIISVYLNFMFYNDTNSK